MLQNKIEKKKTNIIIISPSPLTDIGYAANVGSEEYMYTAKKESNDKNSEKEDAQLAYDVAIPNDNEEVSRQHQKDVEICDRPLINLPDCQDSREVIVYNSKASESSGTVLTETYRKNDLCDELINKHCEGLLKKQQQIDIFINVQEFQKKSLQNAKCVNTFDFGDHAYCQVIEGDVEEIESNMNSRVSFQTKEGDLECSGDTLNVEKLLFIDQKDNEKFNSGSNSSESLEDCNEKINCLDEPEIDYPDNEKLFVLTKDPIVENNVQIYSLPVNNLYGKRKSHKSFMMSWNTQILCNGFAKCLIETCNFISLDNLIMQEHYRSCDGVPNYDQNLCEFCNNWLISEDELTIHKYKCKKKIKGTSDSPCRVRNLEEIAGVSKSEIIKDDATIVNSESLKNLETTALDKLYILKDEKLESSVLSEREFSGNEDRSLHANSSSQQNGCMIKKKVLGKRHPNKCIQKITTEKFDDSCIVQPRRAIPKGQYVRRRGYTKLHKSSWEAALRKYKYVKCIYQNCHFLALSIKDMIYHFGYCDGDGSFAKFVCPYCVGRVTSGKILEIHIQRSHANRNYSATNDNVLSAVTEDNFGTDNAKNEFSNTSNIEFVKSGIGIKENEEKCIKFIEEESNFSNTDHKIKTNDSNISENKKCSFSVDDNVLYKKLLDESVEKVKSNREKSTDCGANNADTNTDAYMNLDVEESTLSGGKDNLMQVEHSSPLVERAPTKKARRSKKTSSKETDPRLSDNSEGLLEVKCAKCEFKTQKKKFSEHNFRKHVGLSWIEGEDPIDMNNEEQISWSIKQAFKLIKYAKCENCFDIKKSAMGFISHVQYCGKSMEEKEALKVKCPHCPSRILKYSLPMHLKLSHSDPVVESNKLAVVNASDGDDTAEVPTKRKSALKAANKVLEVLKQYDDVEDPKKKSYVFYEKGVSKLPKIPCKIRGLWKKMLNEKKKLPCRRGSCLFESSNIQEACNHHFLCNELPDKAFICQFCDFFSSTRDAMQHHISIHNTVDADFAIDTEEEEMEEETENLDEIEWEDFSNVVERKAKSSDSIDESSLEAAFKMEFFIRQSLCKEKNDMFFKRSLRMTLESELEEVKEGECLWPQLHTTANDWIGVSSENAAITHFLSLEESMSIYVNSNNNKNDEIAWEKMKRFEGKMHEGTPLIFTGGSILSMSWCKVSCRRSAEKNTRQYLAVSTCRRMDKFPEIHEKCDGSTGLIQIWDCGELKVLSDVQSAPQMTMGIIHDSGEVWDLSWFPVDTYKESEDGHFLTRLGILGAACQDGTIRIWSVCCPSNLQNEYSSPFYKVEPSVILQLEDRQNEGCLRLSFGRTGIVVGGYNNGIVAVWSLKNVSSPFCKKVGKSFVLKPHLSFQAHKTSVTALSICSNSDRYITTSGLDRYIKFWDLECPANPFENIQREVCFDNLWPKNWPVTISSFEDIVPCLGNSMIKSIRDAYGGKHRTSLSLDNTCWSLSFNDWINVLAGCNNIGEVKVRFMRNMFISNDKLDIRAVHLISTANLKLLTDESEETMQESKGRDREKENCEKSEGNISVPRTYNEACQNFGLILKEFNVDHNMYKAKNLIKTNKKKNCQSLEEFPITSVNKVCWNPNFDSFSFLAIGYHSGFVRIRHLVTRKIQEETLRFSREAKKLISK